MTNEWIDWNDSRMLPPLRSANYNHPTTFLNNNYHSFSSKFHLKAQKLQQLSTSHPSSKLKGWTPPALEFFQA